MATVNVPFTAMGTRYKASWTCSVTFFARLILRLSTGCITLKVLHTRCSPATISRSMTELLFRTSLENNGVSEITINFIERQMLSIRLEFTALTEMTSPSAFYNTENSSKCHPKTQGAILDQLKNWILGNVEPNTSILWLAGLPGSGKSCIARSIAEWCKQQQLLLASFFFLRTDPSRNSTKHFISSLAYTITRTVPDSRPYIEQAIRSDPHVFSGTIDIQMDSLVVDPLYHQYGSESSDPGIKPLTLEGSTPPKFNNHLPHVFVIDGLDECGRSEEQRDIIRLFAATLKKNLGWKILITSRTDPTIQASFDRFVPSGLSTHTTLSNSNADIRWFLEDAFAERKGRHAWSYSIPADWPSRADIDKLVSRSFGLFIYAATVIKYVFSSDFDNPVDRLQSILDHDVRRCDVSHSSSPDLNIAVYVNILQTSGNPGFWL